MHAYNETFYDYINSGATRSARVAVGLLYAALRPASVVDFGCGEGAWLAVWGEHGVSDLLGVDGGYVSRERLLIPGGRFQEADLSRPVALNRHFDLVQSLEVAEHLPPTSAEAFIDSLVAHGRVVVFSAAVPGQGGENHINERPYTYWQDLFARRGYAAFDWLRPQLVRSSEVEAWYRYNMLIFAHRSISEQLPKAVRDCAIAEGAAIPDVSPLSYRVRKAVIRCLPPAAMTALAVVKKHYVSRRQRPTAIG